MKLLRGSSHLDLLAKLAGRAIQLFVTALLLAIPPGSLADVPRPVVTIERPGECVAPPEVIRRNHMDLLKHQRDETMRQGKRGARNSLNACIECHASRKTGSVLGSNENFCQGCHAYVAVKLDCFECHQPKTGMVKVAGAKP